MSTERRCPHCGALVALEAEWCGLCLRPLRPEATPEPEPAEPRGGATAGEPTWPCPACGRSNPLALDACEVCGTPFARLFAEPAPAPAVPPSRAVVSSLLWPGLGHWRVGRRAEGVARMVLFLWTAGAAISLVLSGASRGRGRSLAALYALAAIAVYGLSAVDAGRAAAGEEPVAGSRVLLWGTVGLIVLSVALATLLALPVGRGG